MQTKLPRFSKRTKLFKQGEMVVVWWRDAVLDRPSWTSVEELDPAEVLVESIICSAGRAIREEHGMVMLAQNTHQAYNNYSGIMSIPTDLILRIKKVTDGRASGTRKSTEKSKKARHDAGER